MQPEPVTSPDNAELQAKQEVNKMKISEEITRADFFFAPCEHLHAQRVSDGWLVEFFGPDGYRGSSRVFETDGETLFAWAERVRPGCELYYLGD